MKAPIARLTGLLLTLLASAAPAWGAQEEDSEEAPPPIQLQGDSYILNFSENPDQVVNLEEFVSLCQEATGRSFTYNQTTGSQLTTEKVIMFGTKEVPKEDFYAFFQIMMFINEFVCVEVGPPHISVVLIQGLQSQGRASNLKQKSQYVLPEQLEDFADEPATLITTVLHLPNTDTRTLTTSLRALMTDTNTQTLIAAGPHSVILQGFGSNVASLARLLRIVDRESAGEDEISPVFAVIPLEYAAAEDVANLIEDLLEARSRQSRNNPRRQGDQAQGVSGSLRGGDFETTIRVDGRTNSLLVMAMPEELPNIRELVARLDVDVVEPERNYHIYNLQNVKADEISEVLTEFLQDAERLTRNQGGTGGRAGGGQTQTTGGSSRSNEVVVVPDPSSNTLLVAANKTRYEEVLELLRQLDTRQHQVLIETALIELTNSDTRDIGFEWALADVTEDGGFGVTGFGLSTIDIGPDGLPTRTPSAPTGGLTAGILSGNDSNLPLIVAAAQRTDGANVLNVPSVLVNNNGTARVVTLDEQPTTTITATGGGAGVGQTQENFRGFEEAGITLEISPSISASRYLRLDVSLVVSTFQGVVQGAVPPPRITRELQTTVNVPDGDTMVVGGIITDNLTKTRRSVPFLGDIPFLGALFRRDSDTSQRTTLYFFVTPHILHDRDFADLARISYEKKLEAAETIGQDRVRVVDPRFGVSEDTINFEGFQVPLYRSPARGEVDAESVGLTPQRRSELLKQAAERRRAEPLAPAAPGKVPAGAQDSTGAGDQPR